MRNAAAIFLLLLFFSCSQKPKQEEKSKYFEGFVESAISVHGTSDKTDTALLGQFGDHVTTYIKGRFTARVFTYKNIIVRKEITRPDLLKFFDVNETKNTMATTDLSKEGNIKIVSVERIATKYILDKACIGLSGQQQVFAPGAKTPVSFAVDYYFDSSIILDPKMTLHIKYGGIEKIFGKYNYLVMGYSFTRAGYFVETTATRVVKTIVDTLLFSIPQNKTIGGYRQQ